jgi:hypothetical protein
LGQKDIARSAWAVMVSAGLTPGFAETAAPVDNVQPRVVPDPVPWVHDPYGRVAADDGAAEKVGGQRDVHDLAQ